MKSFRSFRRNDASVIRSHVIALVVSFVVLTAVAAFLGLQLREMTNGYNAILQGSVRDGERALAAQVTFKTQVQEWKNVLLRGSDPEQLKKYTQQFHDEEAKTRKTVEEIVADTNDPVVRTKAEEFLAAHTTMGASYQKALDHFAASGGKDAKGADAIVKGQDRPPTEMLAGLVAHATATTHTSSTEKATHAEKLSDATMLGTGLAVVVVGFVVARGVRRLIRNIGASAHALRADANRLVQVSDELTATATGATSRARMVAGTAETVSQGVQSVAAAIEEMGVTVNEIARNASQADTVARIAAQQAEDANATVKRLGDASIEIGKVIEMITSIAEQTNLLALNATIEAARAGESGKGFAVVANEVKELAKETASATEKISERIAAIQTETNSAVTAIGEITNIIAQVNELQSSIAGAVEEQSATNSEISRSVSQAAVGVSEISANVTSLSAVVEQATTSASLTSDVSAAVIHVVGELDSLVELKRGSTRASKPAAAAWTNPGATRRFGALDESDAGENTAWALPPSR